MRASDPAFVGALVYAHPLLLPILEEHIDDHDGVLPHLLIADVERWAVAQLDGTVEDLDRLRAVLAFLEEGFAAGNPETEELIAVSFLEIVPREGEPGFKLREMVGPRLRGQLEVIG